MIKNLFLTFILFPFMAFSQNTIPKHLNVKEKIGWIPYNKESDNPNFYLCDEFNIEEYYQVNPSYNEGIYSIKSFFEPYEAKLNEVCEKDGYIVIRFIINCRGETDRYRGFFMDNDYRQGVGSINEKLLNKIIEILRKMGEWNPGLYKGRKYDSYQNLKFRFDQKELIDILI